jgi:hypothetical protein
LAAVLRLPKALAFSFYSPADFSSHFVCSLSPYLSLPHYSTATQTRSNDPFLRPGVRNNHSSRAASLSVNNTVNPVLAPIQVPKSPMSPGQSSPSRQFQLHHQSTHPSVASEEARALTAIAACLQQVNCVDIVIVLNYINSSNELQLLVAVKENRHQPQIGDTCLAYETNHNDTAVRCACTSGRL